MSALRMEVGTGGSTFIAVNLRILNVCLRHSLLIETASASPSSKDPIQTSFKRKESDQSGGPRLQHHLHLPPRHLHPKLDGSRCTHMAPCRLNQGCPLVSSSGEQRKSTQRSQPQDRWPARLLCLSGLQSLP